jgi:hypothetical protein
MMKLRFVLAFGLLAITASSSAFAMGSTRSRDIAVSGLTIQSTVELKDTDGNTVNLKDLVLKNFHTDSENDKYYLELDGKSAQGNDVAIRFDLPAKVELDSDDYPKFTETSAPASVTGQSVGISADLLSAGTWSAPAATTQYEPCQRPVIQTYCTQTPHGEVCSTRTIIVSGSQLVRITSSFKSDGYTLNLTNGSSNAAKMNFSHAYSDISEETLSSCF